MAGTRIGRRRSRKKKRGRLLALALLAILAGAAVGYFCATAAHSAPAEISFGTEKSESLRAG